MLEANVWDFCDIYGQIGLLPLCMDHHRFAEFHDIL